MYRDTQHLHGVCQNLSSVIVLNALMTEYLGKIYGQLQDFNEILPPCVASTQELKQQQTFFVLNTLYRLQENICQSMTRLWGLWLCPHWTLLGPCVLCKLSLDDSSALKLQREPRKSGKWYPMCDHCYILSHTIVCSYVLHGRTTWYALLLSFPCCSSWF